MITYSNIVVFFKVFFLITATSILGILFIVSPPDDFGEPVQVSTLGFDKNITYQIIGAKLKGASEEGHRFDFKADSIDPNQKNPENFLLTNIDGTISSYEKDTYSISAKEAFISMNEKFIDLAGALNIKTDSGISGKSENIRIDWKSEDLIVSSEVTLNTPLGLIYGGTMKISNSTSSNKNDTYVQFEKGVKVVYSPNKSDKIE
jgi:hypothetical protein